LEQTGAQYDAHNEAAATEVTSDEPAVQADEPKGSMGDYQAAARAETDQTTSDQTAAEQAWAAGDEPLPTPESEQPATLDRSSAADDKLTSAETGSGSAAASPYGADDSLEETPVAESEEAPRAKTSWLKRLTTGLSRTGQSISSLFVGVKVDENLFEELETALIMADAGVEATEQ